MRLDPKALVLALAILGVAIAAGVWLAIPAKPLPCEKLYSDCVRGADADVEKWSHNLTASELAQTQNRQHR